MAIDKSIRQHYQEGEKVGPFRKGMEMIMPAIPGKKITPTSIAKNVISSGVGRKLAGTGLLSSLGPIGSLLAMFLARRGVNYAAGKIPKDIGQAFTSGIAGLGFGSPQEGRELRQLESRREDMLQRKDEGKNYSEKNLDMVTRAIAEAKGLDINNPNEMKNIDKPITQIQTARSITEAPQVIPPTPEVISPHLEGDTIMPTPITPTGTGGSPSITSRSSAPTYRDPIMDMVTKQTYASPARPHGTQTERLETLLKDDPALGLYNFANLRGITSDPDVDRRAKALYDDDLGYFSPDTGISYVRNLENLGAGATGILGAAGPMDYLQPSLDKELAATVGHEQTHALLEDPRFKDIVTNMNLSKPRGTLTGERVRDILTGATGEDTNKWQQLRNELEDPKSFFEDLQKGAETHEQNELLTRMLDVMRYEQSGSMPYLENTPYALSLHPSGEYGVEGLMKTLTPFADEFTTRAKQLTTPVVQDPDTGSAQIAAIKAEEDRQQRERDAAAAATARAAAAARAYTPPVRHHTGGGGNGGGGGGGYSGDPGGGAAGSPFLKGGRVDKPFPGRSRDI